MKNILHYILLFLLSTLEALFLAMVFTPSSANGSVSHIFSYLDNMKFSIIHSSFLLTLLSSFLFYISIRIKTVKLPKNPLFIISSLILAGYWLVSKGIEYKNMFILLEPSGQILKSIIYFLGTFWMVYTLSKLLYILLSTSQSKNFLYQTGFSNYTHKYKYLLVGIIFFIAWIPHILISNPPIMMIDAWISLNEYYGTWTFTEHHPVLFTLILGTFTRIGSFLESPILGLSLFLIFQVFIFIIITCYTFKFLSDLNAPNWIVIVYTLTLIFSPYYTNRINTIMKDVPYAFCFQLFLIETIYLLKLKQDFFKTKIHPLILSVAIFGVYTLRHNGKYILLPTLIVIFIYLVNKVKLTTLYQIKKYTLLFISPLILGILVNLGISYHYNAQPTSPAERLSLPLQQTAHFVKYYPELVTKEEKRIISKVLQYDLLGKDYYEISADPVKDLFRIKAPTSDILLYLKTWVTMLYHHPWKHIRATLLQNYTLFYPFIENDMTYISYFPVFETCKYPLFEYINFDTKTPLLPLQQTYQSIELTMFSLPLIGVLSHPATHILLSLFLFLVALATKKYIFLIPLLAILLSIVICVLAPITFTHPRYSFPIIYSTPIILTYFSYLQTNTR